MLNHEPERGARPRGRVVQAESLITNLAFFFIWHPAVRDSTTQVIEVFCDAERPITILRCGKQRRVVQGETELELTSAVFVAQSGQENGLQPDHRIDKPVMRSQAHLRVA